MEPQRLTLKEMCARFEVTPRALRYYEYIELLSPERVGRARYYGPREQARLTLILRARRLEFPLEDVRQWLSLYNSTEGNTEQLTDLIERANEQREVLQSRIAHLRAAIEELQQFESWAKDKLSQG